MVMAAWDLMLLCCCVLGVAVCGDGCVGFDVRFLAVEVYR